MGNSNSNANGQNSPHNGGKHASATRRPGAPPRKKSIELPGLTNKPGSAGRHSRIGSFTPVNPPTRGSAPPTQTTPAPINIPTNNTHGMRDVGDHLGSIPSTPPNGRNRSPEHAPPPPVTAAAPPPPSSFIPQPVGIVHSSNEVLVHSSIPLGIVLSSNQGAPSSAGATDPNDGMVPTTITWRAGGTTVRLAGTFESSWRGRIPMNPDPTSPGVFTITIRLPPGNHRLKFIVDDQWRCSDDLPTATDNDGHLVNYIEVPPSHSSSAWDPSSEPASPGASRHHQQHQHSFGGDIPPHLVHSAWLEEQYLSQRMANPPPIPHPAALPRHLEKVILNAPRHGRDRAVMDGVGDDNSVLPVPNHVVLNHLGTSAIKNGVLAVATSMRFHKKYISLIYYRNASNTETQATQENST